MPHFIDNIPGYYHEFPGKNYLYLAFPCRVDFVSGLAPSSNLEKAQADMIVDGCHDLATKLMTAHFEKDETKKVYDTFKR